MQQDRPHDLHSHSFKAETSVHVENISVYKKKTLLRAVSRVHLKYKAAYGMEINHRRIILLFLGHIL